MERERERWLRHVGAPLVFSLVFLGTFQAVTLPQSLPLGPLLPSRAQPSPSPPSWGLGRVCVSSGLLSSGSQALWAVPGSWALRSAVLGAS